jgi:hypothetical protein
MSVQYDEAIVTAAQAVYDKVWFKHWKGGETKLRTSQVVEYIREIRVGAGCTEERLPECLITLLAEARVKDKKEMTMSLSKLIAPLNQIILPPVQ